MNEENIGFWVRMFEPRTRKWRAEKLKELMSGETDKLKVYTEIEIQEKIEALNRIRNGN